MSNSKHNKADQDEMAASKYTRRDFLQLTGAALSSAAFGLKPERAEGNTSSELKIHKDVKVRTKDQQYNILFIFTDQERYSSLLPEALELKGHQRLINEGTNFINHYISATMCTSSRSVILTGLQTSDNGMFENVDMPYVKPMSNSIPNIGSMLKDIGYYTAYKGKWHLNKKFQTEEPSILFIKEMEEYGFSDYVWPGDVLTHSLGGYHFDDMIADSAISWLRQKAQPLNVDNTPWALFISLVNPHDIMYFDTDINEKVQMSNYHLMQANRTPNHKNYRKEWDLPLPSSRYQSLDNYLRPQAHSEYMKAWEVALGSIPNEDWRWKNFNNFYYNSLKAVDRQLERILIEIDMLNLSDNTIIIFTSDHGEMGGAHGLRGKGPFSYEESIHVPFIIKHPDVMGGKMSESLTSHIDIVPTILSMCGVGKNEMEKLAKRVLPGKDISLALNNVTKSELHTVRDSILFTYSGLATNDSKAIDIIAKGKSQGIGSRDALKSLGYIPDLKKRGSLRCVYDGRYKFTRYFSPIERNTPRNIVSLKEYNDIELFDLAEDCSEDANMAYGLSAENLLSKMNAKLNKIIEKEMGEDDGREMPDFKDIDWTLDNIDL